MVYDITIVKNGDNYTFIASDPKTMKTLGILDTPKQGEKRYTKKNKWKLVEAETPTQAINIFRKR